MKHNYFLVALMCMCWLLCSQSGFGQSFHNNALRAIPDSNIEVYAPIQVSGLPAVMDTNFGLISVALTIHHPYDGDLRVSLLTPGNVRLVLISGNGGSGDNFINTVFVPNAQGRVDETAAPFTGSWRPMGSLNLANRGANPNGTWRLAITDAAHGDVGYLDSVSITFGPHPPKDPTNVVPVGNPAINNPAAVRCPPGVDTCDLLPDMTASSRILSDREELAGSLRLSNATPNIGYGPLEVHGTGECYCDSVRVTNCGAPCPDGTYPKEKVIQRIWRKSHRTDSLDHWDRAAGYMSYHPSHGHIHIDNWASYTLRRRVDGVAPQNWPIVATGSKVSFCLVNLAQCDASNGYCINNAGQIVSMNQVPNPNLGAVSGCTRDQGIFPGRADIYNYGLDGQEIPLHGVCNGDYYIVTITDPNNDMLETDDNNNVAFAPVTLSRQVFDLTAPRFSYHVVGARELSFSSDSITPSMFTMWDYGDGTIDSSQSLPAVHRYDVPGSYTVRLTVRTDCGSATRSRNIVVTANGPAAIANRIAVGLSVQPNPTAGDIRVNYNLPGASAAHISLTDALGRTVYTSQQGRGEGEQSLTLNLAMAKLAPGCYTLKVLTEQGAAHTTVVVE